MTTGLKRDYEKAIQLEGSKLKRVIKFNYPGCMTQSTNDLDKEIEHRVQSGWNN